MCLALQAWLALAAEINWDEYFYLSHLYEHARGELAKPLQTFYVHLLGWLTRMPGDEIDQISVGRLVMLLCQAATCGLIYRLARTFFDPVPSLLAVLAFVSAGFSIMHGASFRADPLATLLMMLSLATLARGRTGPITMLAAAASAAVALLVTVKVIFYAPAFAGIAAWRLYAAENQHRALSWLAATGAATALLFAALYALHLSAMPAANNTGAQEIMENAGRTTLLEAGLLPRAREVARAALFSPWQTGLMLFGMIGLCAQAARSQGNARLRALTILSCAAPLLSLLFYRNAFPYFFPFISAPAVLLVAWAVQETAALRARPLVIAAVFALPAIVIAVIWARERPQNAQRQLISAIHEIFPRPVQYIDRNGMIASFPKRGIFMSTWGMQNYGKGPPIFGQLLDREPVPMLLLNSPTLEHAVGVRSEIPAAFTLHHADRTVLANNYIPHWGPVWVAGKRVAVGKGETRMPILVPGTYTVEGKAVALDGRVLRPGETVELRRGVYRLGDDEPGVVTFRWGDHLPRPDEAAPVEPLYRGF